MYEIFGYMRNINFWLNCYFLECLLIQILFFKVLLRIILVNFIVVFFFDCLRSFFVFRKLMYIRSMVCRLKVFVMIIIFCRVQRIFWVFLLFVVFENGTLIEKVDVNFVNRIQIFIIKIQFVKIFMIFWELFFSKMMI